MCLSFYVFVCLSMCLSVCLCVCVLVSVCLTLSMFCSSCLKLTFGTFCISEIMSTSESESDSEHDMDIENNIDHVITESEAKRNYEETGSFMLEESDQISLEKHQHLINPSNAEVLKSVLHDLNLPYHLSDFQTISVHTLLEKKDLLLLSPTGSGKEKIY